MARPFGTFRRSSYVRSGQPVDTRPVQTQNHATLPLSDWLVPTKSDKAAGDGRGRPAGLSGFDRELCPLKVARELLGRRDDFAFGALVSELKGIATAGGRQLDVVYLPLESKASQPGWDGHVLIEGLRRPDGGEKKAQKDLQAIVRVLRQA